jgi:hypothetical protein
MGVLFTAWILHGRRARASGADPAGAVRTLAAGFAAALAMLGPDQVVRRFLPEFPYEGDAVVAVGWFVVSPILMVVAILWFYRCLGPTAPREAGAPAA